MEDEIEGIIDCLVDFYFLCLEDMTMVSIASINKYTIREDILKKIIKDNLTIDLIGTLRKFIECRNDTMDVIKKLIEKD